MGRSRARKASDQQRLFTGRVLEASAWQILGHRIQHIKQKERHRLHGTTAASAQARIARTPSVPPTIAPLLQ